MATGIANSRPIDTHRSGYRFKVGDSVFFNEEVLVIQKPTQINGWPAYWTNELSFPVADHQLSTPPKY